MQGSWLSGCTEGRGPWVLGCPSQWPFADGIMEGGSSSPGWSGLTPRAWKVSAIQVKDSELRRHLQTLTGGPSTWGVILVMYHSPLPLPATTVTTDPQCPSTTPGPYSHFYIHRNALNCFTLI